MNSCKPHSHAHLSIRNYLRKNHPAPVRPLVGRAIDQFERGRALRQVFCYSNQLLFTSNPRSLHSPTYDHHHHLQSHFVLRVALFNTANKTFKWNCFLQMIFSRVLISFSSTVFFVALSINQNREENYIESKQRATLSSFSWSNPCI